MRVSKIFIVMFLALTASMFAQQVQTGTYRFDKNLSDYTLDKNDGDRVVQLEITFKTPFDVKPEVLVSVNFLDCDKATNLRYEVKTISVSRDGFLVQVKTWAETRIFAIGGGWMAVSGK
ncbi:MAG: H-type lectin domain-containing protein [Melioribacteraceae bacterium]